MPRKGQNLRVELKDELLPKDFRSSANPKTSQNMMHILNPNIT